MKTAKIFSILVCLVLLLVIVCRFVFFMSYIHFQKSEFRKEVLKGEVEQALAIRMNYSDIFVNRPGFEWKERGRELVIQGIYHEVISIRYAGGQAIVTIIADKAENDLFKKFFDSHKKNDKVMNCLMSLLLGFQFEQAECLEVFIHDPSSTAWLSETGKSILNGYLSLSVKPPASVYS